MSPRTSTIVVLQLHWSPHWFHRNLEMIKQASLDFVVPTDLTENSFSKIPGLTDYCMHGWFYGHLHRWFCDWHCTCQGCFFIDAMVKTVTINDYARKDEFYPFMHDQWTINTSKVKNFLCEIGQRSKVGMTIFLGLVEYSEASSISRVLV